MRNRGWYLLAVLAIAVLGIIIMLADEGRLPGLITNLYAFPNGDKVGHFCLMGGVSFCVNLALAGRKVHWRSYGLALGSLLVSGLVTLEEFSQIFFAARTFDLLDLSASLLGIWLLGGAAGWLTDHLRKSYPGK
jgi:polysaccharide biosynthesis protein VpsQ